MTNSTPETALSIVIPVYNALEETLDCVTSLLESDAGDCMIYLMDDGSDWAVCEQLKSRFAKQPNIKIISHFRNRGYTRNISMGVKQTSTPFVCILNSDTLLPAVWVGPMLDKMVSDRHLAGIGPLSNAASYQSVPDVIDPVHGGFSNNDGLGFDPAERAQVSDLVRTLGQGQCVDVPILNGFCTIFRRSALDAIGGFDVDNYLQGYGEENDLCIRLKAEGYRLTVFLGVFVHHQKSKSFGSDRKKSLSAKGSTTLARKFGEHFVPALGKHLEQSTSLAAMRRLVNTALTKGQDAIAATESLTAKSKKTAVGAGAKPRCIILSGGGSYQISEDRIVASESNGDDALTISGRPNGLTVSLPKGMDLAVFSTSPIATALYGLSLWSIQQTIYVDHWTPNGMTESKEASLLANWPPAWNMDNINDIPFAHLHLAV